MVRVMLVRAWVSSGFTISMSLPGEAEEGWSKFCLRIAGEHIATGGRSAIPNLRDVHPKFGPVACA